MNSFLYTYSKTFFTFQVCNYYANLILRMDTLMCLTMLFWKTLVRVNHFKMKKISNVHTLLFQTINTFENLESPSHEFVGTAHDGKRALLFFTIVADEYRDFLAILYSFSLKTIATIICSSLRAGRILGDY